MAIQVIGVDELALVIEQTVKATVTEVVRQMKEGTRFEPKDVMTTDELMEYLDHNGVKLTKATIFGYTCKGTMPYHKIGKNLRFKREEIDQWLDEYCNRGRANHKADKSAGVEALAESASEIIKRNK